MAFLAFVNTANAQLPNEKFGKPSSQEWEFQGWGDGFDADAVILCKTMKAVYQISDQVSNNVIYNLAGQRVSKEYKGIVIKNGAKYIAK